MINSRNLIYTNILDLTNNENKTSPIINKSRRYLDLLLILLPPSLFSMRNTKDYHIPLSYHILIGKFTLTSPTVNSDITSVSVAIKRMFS